MPKKSNTVKKAIDLSIKPTSKKDITIEYINKYIADKANTEDVIWYKELIDKKDANGKYLSAHRIKKDFIQRFYPDLEEEKYKIPSARDKALSAISNAEKRLNK